MLSDIIESGQLANCNEPMITGKPKSQKPYHDGVQMPPIVDAILVFFYVAAWVNLIGVSYGVISGTHDGQYGYLLPLGLYALTLLTFVLLNWRRFRKGDATFSDLAWGGDDQFRYQITFILVSFALIIWLTALQPDFANLYLVLFGISGGILSRRWWLAVPVVAAEILVAAYQTGVLAELQKTGIEGLLEGRILALLLGIAVFVMYMVLFDMLISSRIRSEHLIHELQATQKQLEEALATEKEVAVLRERNRLAREMHDVLGHALVLVAVKIEAAQRLQAVDPERAAAELESTKELVRHSMADLRVSLADLRSPTFEAGKMPLGKALGDWTARTAHEGELSVKFESEPGVEALPAPIQDALWRVGREAVLNVVKHARAEHVEVHLFIKDGNVYLSVGDDGVGIAHLAEGTARLEVEGHYGIRGMRERLEVLGGQLTIKPGRDGRGTLLMASVPLPVEDGRQPVPERSEGTDGGGAESNTVARNLSSVVRRP